jgi:hypothetical protein
MLDAFSGMARNNALRTCGILYDIRTFPPDRTEKQDAIAAALDHISRYSVVVIFPYRIDASGELHVQSPFAVEGDYSIFGRPKASTP